jgi:glycosyltransferase involved in cell wall biosynthesis
LVAAPLPLPTPRATAHIPRFFAPAFMSRVLLLNDHPPAGGIGRYARALYHALLDADRGGIEIDLLIQNAPGHTSAADWRGGPGAEGSRVLVQPRPRWAKPTGFGTLYQLNGYFRFPRRIPMGYALYHASSQMMGASARHAAPMVVTVHDVIARRLARNHVGLAAVMRRRHLGAVTAARALIFSSEHTRREFLSLYDYPADRCAVVHLGVAPAFSAGDRASARAALGLAADRPVLLHVGSEERRKNVEATLAALARLVRRRPDVLLVRVGGGSSRSRRLIARFGLAAHVRYCSGLPEADLVRWYRAADAFVFPSFYEGFGLPVLEALACGCPVIAGDASSVPEIAGDAALLVDPGDVEALERAIGRVLDDPSLAAALRAAGPRRAAAFTWARAAAQTLEVYRRTLGGA